MSYRAYRILSEIVEADPEYFVADVLFDDSGMAESWTDRETFNVLAGWHDVDDLLGTIQQLQEVLDKPILRVIGDHLEEYLS